MIRMSTRRGGQLATLGLLTATSGLVALPAAHAAAPAYHPTLKGNPHIEAVVPAGSLLSDSAALSPLYGATGTTVIGTVTFTLYGPFASAPASTDCTATTQSGLYTPHTINVTGGNTTGTGSATIPSGSTTTGAATGIYQWIASYTGDANNAAVAANACGDTTEQFTVGKTSPTLTTTPGSP